MTTKSSLIAACLMGLCATAASQMLPARPAPAPSAGPLQVVSELRRVRGDRFTFIRIDGSKLVTETIAVDGKTVTFRDTEPFGCTYTRPIDGLTPNLSASDECKLSSPAQNVKRTSGALLPLGAGSVDRWEWTYVNAKGETAKNSRECRASGTATVTVPAGRFETHHVICRQGSWTMEHWYHADGYSVQYRLTTPEGITTLNRLVSFEPGG